MRLFKAGKVYDFMSVSRYWIALSIGLIIMAVGLLVAGEAKLGPHFMGGTEIEVAFTKPTEPGDIRSAVEKIGFSTPGVIKVDDPKHPYRYLIRVHEVSALSADTQAQMEKALCLTGGTPETCPDARRA